LSAAQRELAPRGPKGEPLTVVLPGKAPAAPRDPALSGWPADDAGRSYDHAEQGRVRLGQQPLFRKFTPAQAGALEAYTESDFEGVNAGLLAGKVPGPLAGKVRALDAAFRRVPPLAEPVRVYRGMDLAPEELQGFLGKVEAARAGGKAVELPGFTSTSFDPELAADFSGREGKAPVHFEVLARHGLALDDLSVNGGEKEFLLPRGQKFRVAGVKDVPYRVGKETVTRKVIQLEQL
jgi:hypothetical protein